MGTVLLIPLAGPMQSWGTRSRFQERDTEREPSKSGVIGLLCAALGRDRKEPIDELTALKMGVRVDREGLLKKDFQTTQNIIVADMNSWEDQISNRYYLADAAFLVGLEGDEQVLRQLHNGLLHPVWPIFLGRKAYVPSLPLYRPDGLQRNTSLREALVNHPLLSRSKGRERVRLVLESSTVTPESRMDDPVSFCLDRREFRERFVNTEFVPIDIFPKEDDNVPIANTP
jgi:CRISPR system Cascade subunit CasD